MGTKRKARDAHSVSLMDMLILRNIPLLNHLLWVLQTINTPNCKGLQQPFLVLWNIGKREGSITDRTWRIGEAIKTKSNIECKKANGSKLNIGNSITFVYISITD